MSDLPDCRLFEAFGLSSLFDRMLLSIASATGQKMPILSIVFRLHLFILSWLQAAKMV